MAFYAIPVVSTTVATVLFAVRGVAVSMGVLLSLGAAFFVGGLTESRRTEKLAGLAVFALGALIWLAALGLGA